MAVNATLLIAEQPASNDRRPTAIETFSFIYSRGSMMRFLCVGVLSCVFLAKTVSAAASTEPWLAQVKQADATWWEVAFNHCDKKKMEDMLASDIEFVHDEIGIYRGKKAFVELTMENVCKYSDMRRKAVPESMSYEPLRNVHDGNKLYGAVVSGEHLFYAVISGKPDQLVTRARFTHVMLLNGKDWKLSRAISYGHRAVLPENK